MPQLCDMNSIYFFRMSLGMTQSVLADWLGVSRALIAMAEANQRELPGKALNRFIQLKSCLETLPIGEPIHIDPPTLLPKKAKEMNGKIRKLEKELKSLEFQLEKIIEKLEVWRKAIALSKALLEKDFVQQEALLKDAIDRFLDWQYIYWAEQGPREKKILEFYIKQKKVEVEFINSMEASYRTGSLSGF